MRAHVEMMPRLQAGEMLAAINTAALAQPPSSRSEQSARTRALRELERVASDGKSKRSTGVDLTKMSAQGRAEFLGNFGIKVQEAGADG